MQTHNWRNVKQGKRRRGPNDIPIVLPKSRMGTQKGSTNAAVEQNSDVTRMPTTPHPPSSGAEQPPIWQYDSPTYEAESSLPALSLIIEETPTELEIDNVAPEIPAYVPSQAYLPARALFEDIIIEPPAPAPFENAVIEAPTHPEINSALVELPTLPCFDAIGTVQSQALLPQQPQRRQMAPAVAAALERYKAPRLPTVRPSIPDPFDRLRWWLLHPGRLEFILWLTGTIVLVTVTLALLLVTAFSFEWIVPGQLTGMAPDSLGSPPGPSLMLMEQGPLFPGQAIHLYGEGFSKNGRVIFTHDDAQSHPAQNVLSAALLRPVARCDAQGKFTLTLTLPAWAPGHHVLVAHDVATHRVALLQLNLVARSVTPTPVPSPNSSNQAGQNGPSTPVPTTPPAIPSPTPAPAKPSPTPGITPTPTPSPTPAPGLTPTPAGVSTPTASPTPTKGTSSTSSTLSIFLSVS